MSYNSNNLYNNYIPKNTTIKPSLTQNYPFFQSPSKNPYQNTNNKFQNLNQNFSSSSRQSNYYNQTMSNPNQKNSLKWRNIMKIDLPLLQNCKDINLIQPNINNLVYGEISEEDIQTLPENNIVRLIQILQTSGDILLNDQQDLEGEIMKLETQNMQIMNEYKTKEKSINKNKDLICQLKKEKNRDISVLDTYRNAINNLKNGNTFNFKQIKTNITDININKREENSNLNSNRKGDFKCEFCPDKKFMTEFELKKHLSEVHGIDKLNQNQINQSINQFPKEIHVKFPDEYLQRMNQNDNNNEYLINKMDEMQKNFQETMSNLMQEKKNQESAQNFVKKDNNFNQEMMDRFEKSLKETVNDFKIIMEKNNENQNEQNVIIQEQEDEPNDEYNNWKRSEIMRLNEELNYINIEKEKEEKNYESQIEELENYIKTLKIEIVENKKFREDEEKENHKPINLNTNLIKNRTIEYQTQPVKIKKEIKQKTYFNAGKLMSDHDDSDEEFERRKRIIELYNNDRDFVTKFIKNKTVLTDINIGNQNIPSSTINQNTFFNANGINKNYIIPEVSQSLEITDNREQNIMNKEKNVELDKYYKRYRKRDNGYLNDPKFINYFVHTLPSKFDENQEIEEKSKNLMKDKILNTGVKMFPNNINMIPQIEEENLKKENADDLAMLFDSLMNNMEKENVDQKGNQDEYYKSIKVVLGLYNMINNAKEIYNKHNFDLGLKKKIVLKMKKMKE